MPITKRELKKIIKVLEKIRGRHTELVSIYVPQGYNINEITTLVRNEQGTASNIKSKTVRKNVTGALTKIDQILKHYKQTPPNGLVIFCGNISENEGVQNLQLWHFEPPEPIKMRTYRCDQTFILEPLREQIEEKEVYGLITIDTSEATIGFLKGKAILLHKHLNSLVPGKQIKGGQCLTNDTLVMIDNGEIIKIKELHNPLSVVSANFSNYNTESSPVVDKWKVQKNRVYKISTMCPRVDIKASGEHTFFIWENKIKEIRAKDLKEGQHLLMPEKIRIKGKKQKLTSKESKIELPREVNEDFAQMVGYFMGDGSYDSNKLCFHEQNKELIEKYQELIKRIIKCNSSIVFRKDKNYYLLRVYNKSFVELLKNEFPEIKSSRESYIPSKILKSENEVLAAFLRGFFDAEGYVSSSRIGLGINNKELANQIRFVLLRFEIISSVLMYDNRKNKYSNNMRYTIEISDIKSLNLFKECIGFTFKKKTEKLVKLIDNRTNRDYTRQVLISGKEIKDEFRKLGLKRKTFPKVSNFFEDKRMMSKGVYESSILDYIKENKELYKKLKEPLERELIPVRIKNIEISEEKVDMTDISTKNQNFVANGLIVHNSAPRFERVRKGMLLTFMKQVGEIATSIFSEVKELKGIIIGGPGPIKETFVSGDFLSEALKKQILGTKDLGYVDESGLKELVEKSEDLLKEASVTHEKQLLKEFFEHLKKDDGLVAYGMTEVNKAIEMGAVDTLIISEEFPMSHFIIECNSCKLKVEKNMNKDKLPKECPICKGKLNIEEADIFEQLEDKADQMGSNFQIVSSDTPEGNQFLQLGGIGTILRFKIN